MRVVFDTNVLVSALLFPGGRADEAMVRVISGQDDLLLSAPILSELLAVLASKFSRDKEELSRVAVILSEIGQMVRTVGRISVLRDEADNRVLECAVEGNADLIVTGDKAMLALGEYGSVRIVSLADYLGEKAGI